MNKLSIPKNPEDKKFHIDGKINFQGLELIIENWKGSTRKGKDENGKEWMTILTCPYGYISNSIMDSDKDHLDVFLGNNPDSEMVFVIKQIKKDKSFDEFKVMLGFDSEEGAKEMYFSNYDTKKQYDSIIGMTMKEFKKKIKFEEKGKTVIDENTFEKSNDVSLFIDLEKARVKQHTSKTKSGKLVQVKEHSANVGRKKKGTKKNPWIKKFGHLKLTRFPDVNVKPKDVKVDTEGDIHSKAVLVWKDPKTNKLIHAYTSEYMKGKKDEKYKRVGVLDEKKLDILKKESLKNLKNDNIKIAQSSAALFIIAETGLRVGSHRLLEQTGNKGVVTASPKDFKVSGDTITIDYKGKSYVENTGSLKNKQIADYIKNLQRENSDKKFLFDQIDHSNVGNRIKRFLKDKSLKTKDLRTYVGSKLGEDILFKNKIKPGEMPEGKTKQKKFIKEKIDKMLEEVSRKLNNTKAVAKSSYVNPVIIDKYLRMNKIDPSLYKAEIDELLKAKKITVDLDDMIHEHEKLVKILKNGDKKKLKKELEYQSKELKEYKEMNKANDEIGLFIDLEKATVKEHARRTKTGKMSQVKQYTDKRMKKNVPEKQKKEKVLFKTKAEYEKMNKEKEQQNQQNNQQDNNGGLQTILLDKEKKHLEFMMNKYPDLINKEEVGKRLKQLTEAKRKMEDILLEVRTGSKNQDIKNDAKEESKNEFKEGDKIKYEKNGEIFDTEFAGNDDEGGVILKRSFEENGTAKTRFFFVKKEDVGNLKVDGKKEELKKEINKEDKKEEAKVDKKDKTTIETKKIEKKDNKEDESKRLDEVKKKLNDRTDKGKKDVKDKLDKQNKDIKEKEKPLQELKKRKNELVKKLGGSETTIITDAELRELTNGKLSDEEKKWVKELKEIHNQIKMQRTGTNKVEPRKQI